MKCCLWRLLSIAAAAWLLDACGDPDLGPCDEKAAKELVYSANGMVATKGQALVHDSCGNGAFCHSSGAKGSARMGAPAGMNFDMLPAPTGWPELIDRRDEIWDQVSSGDMPPGKAGSKVMGDGKWSFAVVPDKHTRKLPSISSHEGKAAVRNWLACGAPLVSDTKVPSWALPPQDAGSASGFDAIYTNILQPNCAIAGCHNATGNAGSLKMVDACSAYKELLKSGPCGMPRVRPGDGGSLLLKRLESTTTSGSCTSVMPPSGPLAEDKAASVRTWIEDGAEAPACP